jgi:hypothetical protein
MPSKSKKPSAAEEIFMYGKIGPVRTIRIEESGTDWTLTIPKEHNVATVVIDTVNGHHIVYKKDWMALAG